MALSQIQKEELQSQYILGEISLEEYQEAISEDPTFLDNLNRGIQNLQGSSWAGVRAIGEQFDNSALIERANEGIEYRDRIQEKLGRPMMVEDIKSPGDLVDYVFTDALPQVIPSIFLSLAGAAIGARAPVPPPARIVTTGLGIIAPTYLANVGQIEREIEARAGPDVESSDVALAGGLALSALDVLGLTIALGPNFKKLVKESPIYTETLDAIVDKFVTKGVAPNVAKQAVYQTAKGAIAEGTVEASQEVISDILATTRTGIGLEEDEYYSRLVNAFALGTIGGGTVGLPSGYIQGRDAKRQFLAKQLDEENARQTKAEVNQFVIDQGLEQMPREQLVEFILDRYRPDASVRPVPIDVTQESQEAILADLKALEFSERFVANRKENVQRATLPELNRADEIRKEKAALNYLDATAIRKIGSDMGLDIRGSLENLINKIAVQRVDAKFMQSPSSRFLLTSEQFENNLLEFNDLSRGELEMKARELLPGIYGTPDQARDINQPTPILIKELAEQKFYLDRSANKLENKKGTTTILIDKNPEAQERTLLEEISPENPERGLALGFSVDVNGQKYVFEKELETQGNVQRFIYREQSSGRTYGEFEMENFGENINIDTLTIKKADYPQFKETYTDSIRFFLSKLFGSQRGYTPDFFEANRSRMGRIRAINNSMQFLFQEYQNIKNSAVRDGTLNMNEDTINQLGLDYLTSRYTRKRLSPGDPVIEIIARQINALQTKRDNATNEAAIRHLDKQIEALQQDQRDGVATNEVTLAKLPPKLRGPLIGMRAMIDRLSQRLLDEMPAEVLDKVKKVRKADPRTGEITLEEEPAKDIIRGTMGSYVTEQYKLFEEGLGWNPRSLWNRLAPNKEMRGIYDEAVSEIQNISPNLSNKDARRLVNELIDQSLNEGQISGKGILQSMYKVDASQKTISPIEKFLSQKQGLPKAFKRLFGEFKDPSEVALTTASKLVTFVENYRFYNKLKEINQEIGTRMFTTAPSGKYDTLVPLDDTPLDGLYTTKEMAEALRIVPKDKTFVERLYEGFVMVPKIAVQSFKTVYSILAQSRNFITASMFYAHRNGRLWNDIPAGARVVYQELGGGYTRDGKATINVEKANQETNFLKEEGVINTTVTGRELIESFQEVAAGSFKTINELDAYLRSNSKNAGGFLLDKAFEPIRFVTKVGRGATKVYQAADDFWKTAAFYGELNRLKRNFAQTEEGKQDLYDFATRLGVKISTKDFDIVTKKTAAYIVRNTIPNYDYVGVGVDFLRKKLPLAPFVAFPSEIIRTAANAYRIGALEATFNKNRKTQAQGLRGILGMSFMVAGLGTIAQKIGMAAANMDEEDIEYLRKLAPDFSKNSKLIPIEVEEGVVRYIDGSHFLVYDTIARMGETVIANIKEGQEIDEPTLESIGQGFAEAIYELAEVFLSLSIAPEIQLDLIDPTRRDRIASPALLKEGRWDEYVGLLFDHAFKTGQPGFFQTLMDVKKGLTPDEYSFNKYNTKKDFDDAMNSFAGVKISEVDIARTMPFIINKAKRNIDKAERLFEKLTYEGGPVFEEDLVKEFHFAQKGTFIEQQELYLNYLAALSLARINNPNYSKFKKDLDKQIEERLGRKFAKALTEGKFTPFNYSETAEDKYNKSTKQMQKEGLISREPRVFPKDKLDAIYDVYERQEFSLLDNVDVMIELLNPYE